MRFFFVEKKYLKWKKILDEKNIWNFENFRTSEKNLKFSIGKSIFFIGKYIEIFGFFSDFWKFSNFQIFFSSKIFFHFKIFFFNEKKISCQSEILCRFQKSYLERLAMSANVPLSPAPLFFPYLNKSLHMDGWPSIILWLYMNMVISKGDYTLVYLFDHQQLAEYCLDGDKICHA